MGKWKGAKLETSAATPAKKASWYCSNNSNLWRVFHYHAKSHSDCEHDSDGKSNLVVTSTATITLVTTRLTIIGHAIKMG